jgi:NADH-quinone oxidoreductase subunit E
MLGMFKAMRQTMSHLPKKKLTVQYPEQREVLPARSRGLFRVVIDPTSGDPRCRSCTLCESNCPVQVIRVNYTSKYRLPVPNAARIAEARVAAQQGIDVKALQPVLDDYYEHGTGLIAMLQNAQEVYGYLPRITLQEISLQTGVSLVGEYIIDVCHGTACHVAGAVQITEALEEELGVADGKTTSDMKFTLSSVACMGACSQAPVMRIGDQTYGGLTPDSTRKIIRDLMEEVGGEKG